MTGKIEIYVGNLPPQVNAGQLSELFQHYGKVTAVRIITDKFSGLPRGFGFVEMPERDEAVLAIANLAGRDFHGGKLDVREALTKSHIKGND